MRSLMRAHSSGYYGAVLIAFCLAGVLLLAQADDASGTYQQEGHDDRHEDGYQYTYQSGGSTQYYESYSYSSQPPMDGQPTYSYNPNPPPCEKSPVSYPEPSPPTYRPPPIMAPPPTCTGPACENQNDPSKACWKCLGYNSYENAIVLNVTACNWESTCCLTPGCKAIEISESEAAAFVHGRSLLQLRRPKLVKYTFTSGTPFLTIQGSSSSQTNKQSSINGKRRALQGHDWQDGMGDVKGHHGHHQSHSHTSPSPSSAFPPAEWTHCPAIGPKCCVVGPPGYCAQGHVCTITINFKNPNVCPPVHVPESPKPSPKPSPPPEYPSPPPEYPSPPPPSPSPPYCPGVVCEDQSNPATACWKCLGYNPALSAIAIDATKCGWQDVCCLTPGCTVTPINDTQASAFVQGRSLLQLRSRKYRFDFRPGTPKLTIQAGSSTQRSKQATINGRRKLQHTGPAEGYGTASPMPSSHPSPSQPHASTSPPPSLFPTPIWQQCPKVNNSCCIVGPPGPCSQGHVCTIEIDFQKPSVCKRISVYAPKPSPPPYGYNPPTNPPSSPYTSSNPSSPPQTSDNNPYGYTNYGSGPSADTKSSTGPAY